jgi:hypothetical protein
MDDIKNEVVSLYSSQFGIDPNARIEYTNMVAEEKKNFNALVFESDASRKKYYNERYNEKENVNAIEIVKFYI